MSRNLALCVALTVVLASPSPAKSRPPVAATAVAKSAVAKDGWPQTRAGAWGRGWVRAFSSGDSAMRAFLGEAIPRDSLAQRPMDGRIATYHKNRERYGDLVLGSVTKSTETELIVSLLASDGSPHEFIFKVQPKPPYQLMSIGRRETVRRPHGFGMFHH